MPYYKFLPDLNINNVVMFAMRAYLELSPNFPVVRQCVPKEMFEDGLEGIDPPTHQET